MSQRIFGRKRPGLTAQQDIYAESSTALHNLGDVLELGDRVFRYCKNGAVQLSAAYMTSAPAVVANYFEQAQTAYGSTAGQRIVNVVLGAAPAADALKDGYLCVNKGTGLGGLYKIKSNTAANSPCVVTLYDDVVTAWAASSECSVVVNPRNGVLVFPTTPIGKPTGVPLITVTASYYFWAQVKGPCPVVVDAGDTSVVGENAGGPTAAGTAGGAGVVGAVDTVWGTFMTAAAAGEAAIVDLRLE